MKRTLALLSLLLLNCSAQAATPIETTNPDLYSPAVMGPDVVLSSNGTASLAARETAGPDTFALYGGPDRALEGKFQLANGVTPDWGGGNGLPYTGAPGEWTPVDLTNQPVYWHRSQFNAQTLGTTQPSPNHAMWSGIDVGDPLGEGYEYLPGYGDNWNDALIYQSEVLADPSIGQTVNLDFYFHHDVEPGYDWFIVEYDSAGSWTTVFEVTGTDADTLGFAAPGVQLSAVQTAPIFFAGNDYGGNLGDRIRIRIRVESDAGWSDEDGRWPTAAGAAQIDEISLNTSQGSFTEDFETIPVPPAHYLFRPDKASFAGDFAEVYSRITDIDPCRSNDTPVIGFVDYNQIVRNGPGVDGSTSTGGSTSPGVSYGVTGNYVVNYTGGLSFGEARLTNEVWSPDISWDLPGADDDGPDVAGAFIRWTGWVHLPLTNGIFYVWHVRSALPGQPYTGWEDRNFVYYGGGVPLWWNHDQEVTNLLQAGPERVQMALGVWDYADLFGFPGNAATPSPYFDNAAFYKYRVGGPALSQSSVVIANDGFPPNGSIDVSSAAARDALDIPFDRAGSVSSGPALVPGDSVAVTVTSVIPGATVTDIRMFWSLATNPVFEDALRSPPARTKDQNVVSGPAGTMWTGEVVADTGTTSTGQIIRDQYFVDLPDVDLMYPGDVLHYYIQATDSDGRRSTLPANVDGFLDFAPTTLYSRTYTVRGLPTITDTAGTQPAILVWDDYGGNTAGNWVRALQQLGYAEGIDYDSYTTRAPTSFVSNGLGSAGGHGANPDQLAGYNHMLYFAENLSTGLLSNGSNLGNNDKSNDIDLMEQWHALPGPRNCAYFGENIGSGLSSDSAEGLAYLTTVMGVALGDDDVRDVIGGQTAPLIVPDAGGPFASSFSAELIAYGGCLAINKFDQIQPGPSAVAGHLFTDPGGNAIPSNPDPALGGVASVIHPTANGVDITFPFGGYVIYTPNTRATALSSSTRLIGEVLGLFQVGAGTSPIVPTPQAERVALMVAPNPFNPSTIVKFSGVIGKRGSIKVYNLRGELVRTLHTGEFRASEFLWDGADMRGAPVASGVYFVQAETEGKTLNKKVALVK